MNMSSGALAVCLVLFGITEVLCAQQPIGEQTAKVYTSSQAQQGASVYARQCAACHGDKLAGAAGPALKGATFNDLASAQHLTVKSLLDVISRTMPPAAA